MRLTSFVAVLIAAGVFVSLVSTVSATPYASGVRNTTGSTWEFVLNETADNVTVMRDGGNAVNLGNNLAPGRYTFDMTGFTSFDVKVAKNAPATWSTISGAGNAFSNFSFPTGVAINTIPSNLSYFGTVYVAQDRPTATAAGRTMGDGIYALTADMKGVDAATHLAVADPNDATQAKAPNFSVTGANNSPWRLSLDAAGNVIVADWSDAHGGIKYATPDLLHGGPLLVHEDGHTPLLGSSADGSTGPEIHGSIAAKVVTTGSVGNNLVVYGMDEDMDNDGETLMNATSGNNIWRWNVGNLTNPNPGLNPTPAPGVTEFAGGYDQAPTNVNGVPSKPWIDGTLIPKTTGETVSRQQFLSAGFSNAGVAAGMHYDSTFNKWYLVEPRDAGNESCVTILNAPGDGTSTVAWSSLQFSIDHNIDGNRGTPTPAAGDTSDIQDIFRRVREVSISPDHKFMALNRSVYTADLNADYNNDGATNARDYVIWRKTQGTTRALPQEVRGVTPGQATVEDYNEWVKRYGEAGRSDVPTDGRAYSPQDVNDGMGDGDVIIIPLDANGLPDIHLDANGNMTNVITLSLVNNINAHGTGAQLEFDAAGNLYVADSGVSGTSGPLSSQLVQVFSPGGNWLATTSYNGTTGSFTLSPVGGGAGNTIVPEPATLGMMLIGLLAFGSVRRRR